FHDLIEAFEIAHPPDMKLVIAGAAPPEDRYAAQLLRKRSDRVFFAGFQTAANLRALYENAALFVHASYMEGFALVILEALSAGAPVILSDITANREFDLEEHLYFPVGDVYALAEKLAPGNYEVYACARSNEVLRENNWDEIARRHLKIFSASVGQDTPLIAA
ncbi:MAG: glycosyltransferase, partial [Hyphomonadaceae bacterium]